LRWIAAHVGHHLLYLFCAALSLFGKRYQLLFVEVILFVHLYHLLEQAQAVIFSYSRHLSNQSAGRDAILVAHKVADHVTVAFFAAANIYFLAFQLTNLFSDILKAGQGFVVFYAVAFGNLFYQVGGNDSFYNKLLAG
jgi:hypothetical protein